MILRRCVTAHLHVHGGIIPASAVSMRAAEEMKKREKELMNMPRFAVRIRKGVPPEESAELNPVKIRQLLKNTAKKSLKNAGQLTMT